VAEPLPRGERSLRGLLGLAAEGADLRGEGAAVVVCDERAALERLSGRRVEAYYEIDPALIAGAVVRVGSTIYDGSVRTQLERLRARLESQ